MLFAVDGFAATGSDAREAARSPIARPPARARGTRPPAGRCAWRRRRSLGGAWGARRREDRAARLGGRARAAVAGLRTIGVEGEMELPFAALQQLCSPVLERSQRLPD